MYIVIFSFVSILLFGGLFIFCARLLYEEQQNLKKEGVMAYSVTMSRYRKTMIQCFFIVSISSFFLGMFMEKIIS